jgi:hypothetical protein
LQATSNKLQAGQIWLQAASNKLQAGLRVLRVLQALACCLLPVACGLLLFPRCYCPSLQVQSAKCKVRVAATCK